MKFPHSANDNAPKCFSSCAKMLLYCLKQFLQCVSWGVTTILGKHKVWPKLDEKIHHTVVIDMRIA